MRLKVKKRSSSTKVSDEAFDYKRERSADDPIFIICSAISSRYDVSPRQIPCLLLLLLIIFLNKL